MVRAPLPFPSPLPPEAGPGSGSEKALQLFSSKFMTDVEDPERRSCDARATPAPASPSRLSRLHKEVWEAFLLGTGAGGGPSSEFSHSGTSHAPSGPPSALPHTSNTRLI